jgi:hypothetical protein
MLWLYVEALVATEGNSRIRVVRSFLKSFYFFGKLEPKSFCVSHQLPVLFISNIRTYVRTYVLHRPE